MIAKLLELPGKVSHTLTGLACMLLGASLIITGLSLTTICLIVLQLVLLLGADYGDHLRQKERP